MRHHNKNRKFGRVRKVRRALLRSLAEALIVREKIVTTEAKAKELRPVVEKLVSQGRLKNLASQRLLVSRLGLLGARKLVNTISPRYTDRKGGYLRITKLGRKGAGQIPRAQIEFV